jgi:hypothetical protein
MSASRLAGLFSLILYVLRFSLDMKEMVGRAALAPWLPQIAGIVTSILLLAALAAVLKAYNGKPVFDFCCVSLNTIVSVLSTASKATLLSAIESLVGQWKWIIFTREERPLVDFDNIDAASRGPEGSLKMLWTRRTMYV